MQPARLSQIQQWNSKRCGIFSNLTMKKPEDYQCFLISPYKWGRSDGCSCIWICFKCYFSIIYFIWYMARYTMRQTPVTRSTSCKLAFKSTDFSYTRKSNFSSPDLVWTVIFRHRYKWYTTWPTASLAFWGSLGHRKSPAGLQF